MIIPNVEERFETVVNKIREWRVVRREFLPTQYTDVVEDKQVLPTDFSDWKEFSAPYTIYEQNKYFWFKANFKIKRDNKYQKAYLYLNNSMDGRWLSSTIRPQGLLYLNGKIVQGIDINHPEVYLEDGEYEMYLLFYSHECFRYLPMDFSLQYVDERVDKIYYDLFTPFQAVKLFAKNSNECIETLNVVERVLNILDLRNPHSDEFYKSIEQAVEYLRINYYEKHSNEIKPIVNCIAHTHIDVAWLWDLDQTKQKVERSFSTVLKLMDEYPNYRFFSSQPQLFDFLKQRNPELYEKVKQKVLEGRWEIDGSMWLEADCNLTSGESLVRQIIFGKKFVKEEFGRDCKTVWLPDVFGYSASLPQIMRKSGVENFITAKIGWNDTDRMPYDIFTWRGIDGSEVFAYLLSTCECDPRNGVYDHTYTTYTAPIYPMYVLGTWNRFQQKQFTDQTIMSYGWGDGGGGPTREDLEQQKRLEYGVLGLPKTKIESLEKTIDVIKDNFERNSKELRRKPVWDGELYFEYHRGTLTSVPEVKMNNRKGEFALLNAELFATVSNRLFSEEYPTSLIDENWKLLLLNQFHDILPGSSIGDVYKDSREQFKGIFKDSNSIIENTVNLIAKSVKSNGGTLVFNPNGFKANGTVKMGDKTLIARDIPALGYKVISDFDSKKTVKVSPLTLENSYYKITFDKSGAICSLVDKRNGREVVKDNTLLNEFVAYQDTPIVYDNWEMTPYHGQNSWQILEDAQFEILDEGDRQGFKITKRYQNSTIYQKVYLYEDGIDRIDFVTDVDWNEKRQLLKVLFPIDVLSNTAKFDIQFGHVERAIHSNTSWDSARFESAGQKWVDVSENGYGVSILNDGKYGFGCCDGYLSMTVLKSGGYPFEGASEIIPTFTYSLLPHVGDCFSNGVVEKSYVLNRPFVATKVEKCADNQLIDEFSLVECKTSGVILETVKMAQSGEGIVVRGYEAHKERKIASVRVGNAKKVFVCDLNENETGELTLNGDSVEFTVKPFEIITLKIIY